jgi:hypothetical protein
MAATAMKICTVCNTDCADRPRVKDEAGRYTCRACVEKQQAKGNAGLDEDGLDLRSAAMIEAKTDAMDLPETQACPKCQGFMPGGQRLCMRCGYDRKRGAKVTTRVEKIKEVKESKRRQPLDITWIVVGFGLLTVGCAVSTFVAPIMIIPAALLFAALALGLYITMISCQFRDGETIYAICSIIGFFTGGLTSLASLFWLFAVNDRGWLKGLWACMILSYVILIASIMNSADGFQGVMNGVGAGSDGN